MFKKGDVVRVKEGRDLIHEGHYGRVVGTNHPNRNLVAFRVGKEINLRSYHDSELYPENDAATTITFVDPDLMERVRELANKPPFVHLSIESTLGVLAWLGLEHFQELESWNVFETAVPQLPGGKK